MQRGVQSHLFDTNITATWRTRTELPGFHWKPPWSKVDAGGFIKWWRRYCTSYHTITRLRRTWKRTGRCYLVQYRASQTCLRSCEFIDGQRLGLTRWLKDGLDIRPTHLSVRPREWASWGREKKREGASETGEWNAVCLVSITRSDTFRSEQRIHADKCHVLYFFVCQLKRKINVWHSTNVLLERSAH